MRFVTCRLPDGVEDPAILSQDGTQVWPLSWLGLSYETLSDAIPFLTPQVRFGLQLAISGIPALPVEAVTLQSPIPCPAQDVVCLGINYMAHSDEAEKYSADAFSTQHQDAIYFSKRVSRAVPDGGFIEAHTDLVQKLDYECELAVVLGKDAKDVPAGQTKDYVFGYTILNDVSARDVQTAHKQWYFGKSLDGFTPMGPCIVTADEFVLSMRLRRCHSRDWNMYLLKVPVLEILPMQRRFWKLQKYWLGKYMISVAVFVWWTATIFWISWRTKLPSTVS